MSQPQFLREFSQDESPEERAALARELRQKRREHAAEREELSRNGERLSEEVSSADAALETRRQEASALSARLEEINVGRLSALRNYFEIKAIRSRLAVGEQDMETLSARREQASYALSRAPSSQDVREQHHHRERLLLEQFYRSQQELWDKAPYTFEQAQEYFSEEHLKTLNVEEYGRLLRRFPGAMLTHVTRQGVRDHIGHMWHRDGEGKATEGFERMLADGRLRSPLGVYLAEEEKEKAVAEFLRLDHYTSKEEAMKDLEQMLHPEGGQGSYADRMAIHFAAEEVADTYYGSERGNEIFIACPSALVATQYPYMGNLTEGGGGYWNDQWVWANEERGISLDAALVFIPAKAQVDPETGSRYQLDGHRAPQINEAAMADIRRCAERPEFLAFARHARDLLGSVNQDWTEQYIRPENRKNIEEILSCKRRLEESFGVTDAGLQRVILDYSFLDDVVALQESTEEENTAAMRSLQNAMTEALKKHGRLYRLAESTVPSRDYWERYFEKHPGVRPSKVVYYDEEDPSDALQAWRSEHWIAAHKKGKELFERNRVQSASAEAVKGRDAFAHLARTAIERHFADKGGEHAA